MRKVYFHPFFFGRYIFADICLNFKDLRPLKNVHFRRYILEGIFSKSIGGSAYCLIGIFAKSITILCDTWLPIFGISSMGTFLYIFKLYIYSAHDCMKVRVSWKGDFFT